jgi:hypothetical protein
LRASNDPCHVYRSRRFFLNIRLAAGLIADIPLFINYSVNGRGYTMLVLFASLLANFAGILVVRQSKPALIAFILTAALGFYTIPIFLYPMAGISLWVVVTYLFSKERSKAAARTIRQRLYAGRSTHAGLYSPVIFFWSCISPSSAMRSEMLSCLFGEP